MVRMIALISLVLLLVVGIMVGQGNAPIVKAMTSQQIAAVDAATKARVDAIRAASTIYQAVIVGITGADQLGPCTGGHQTFTTTRIQSNTLVTTSGTRPCGPFPFNPRPLPPPNTNTHKPSPGKQ